MIFTWKGISLWKWEIFSLTGLKNKIGKYYHQKCPYFVSNSKNLVLSTGKCELIKLWFSTIKILNIYASSFGCSVFSDFSINRCECLYFYLFICIFDILRNFDEQSPDNALHTQELLATLIKKIDEHCSKVTLKILLLFIYKVLNELINCFFFTFKFISFHSHL